MNKRRSLPADLHLPHSYSGQYGVEQNFLTRASRRQSMSEIGFGRMETYTKLDKLGQVIIILNLSPPRPFNKYFILYMSI